MLGIPGPLPAGALWKPPGAAEPALHLRLLGSTVCDVAFGIAERRNALTEPVADRRCAGSFPHRNNPEDHCR